MVKMIVLFVLTVLLVAACERMLESTEQPIEEVGECPCYDADAGHWIWIPCDLVTEECDPPNTYRMEE